MTNDENADNDSVSSTVTNVGGGDCPEQYSLPIVWRDSFECYEPFAIDNIGNWISYDNDGGTTWGSNDVEFTNESYVGSGIIFNYPLAVSAGGGDISTWNTYEGTQGLYFFASGANSTTIPNDDWMISPEFTLDGVTSPQLTFWAKSVTDQYGLERFKVAVGNSSDYNDFTVISSGNYIEAPTSWTEYQFDLSAYEGQTIRLAIHYVANDSFALQMDSFVVEGTLGFEDLDFNDIQYFYNPVSRTLEISSNQLLEKVEIYNLLGQNIISEEIDSVSATYDLSNLDTSIYIVKIRGISGIKSFKLQVR